MTIAYNAGYKECKEGLVEQLKKVDTKGFELNEDELEVFSKLFHSFIKRDLFAILYKNPSYNLNKVDFLRLDDAELNLLYFYLNKEKIKKDVKLGDERWVFTRNSTSLILNGKDSDIAKNANYIQARDAHFARFIVISIKDVYCIHDCFGVSIYNTHLLMDKANNYFNLYLDDSSYSAFILI